MENEEIGLSLQLDWHVAMKPFQKRTMAIFVLVCVTSHGSFDVIKKLLWTLIKDTIILLVLVFVLLLLL